MQLVYYVRYIYKNYLHNYILTFHIVGSPVFGWLGDRIKQRRLPMLLGTIASMAANLLFMLSTTYPMLLIARFLQGVSNACVWTMCLCLIADNWPKDQLGVQMGKLVGFYPLGMMVGLPAGGNYMINII